MDPLNFNIESDKLPINEYHIKQDVETWTLWSQLAGHFVHMDLLYIIHILKWKESLSLLYIKNKSIRETFEVYDWHEPNRNRSVSIRRKHIFKDSKSKHQLLVPLALKT